MVRRIKKKNYLHFQIRKAAGKRASGKTSKKKVILKFLHEISGIEMNE